MTRRGLKRFGLLALAFLGGAAALVADMNPSSMPLGSVLKGFVMPQRNAAGDLQANVTGDEAKVVSPNRIVITNLKVDLYDRDGRNVTTTITSPLCDFWHLERRLSGHDGVLIVRPESRISADEIDWDFKSQTALLHRNVKVVLDHFAVGGAASAPAAPAEPSPTAP